MRKREKQHSKTGEIGKSHHLFIFDSKVKNKNMSKPVPIWKLPSFSSIFGDPFIGGTALDGGHPVDSANAILYALHHITTFCQETEETSEQVLSNQKSKYFSPDNVAIIQKLMKYIDSYRQIASKQIKESNEFLPFLSEFSTMLDNLQVSECFLIPGGWDGKNDSGSLTYIVERTSEVLYSFVTCNGGCSGIEFHPSSSTENGKLKFKTCIRLNNIASKKIKDKAFWSTMFSLWLKQPAGEYQRGEVIYDVLLPWLSGGLLPTALAKTEKDHRAEWRTPCKSGGSATYKSLWESVRYLGLHMGLAPNVLKQLSFCVRQTLLQTIGRDLCVMGDMSAEFQMYKVPNPDERTIRDILTEVLPINSSGDAMNSIAPFENKVIALYFSGSWCGPCQQFTPLLKEFYTAVKREGKPFEIVFISHDRSIDEFNQYYSKMPWHALPYNQIGRKAAQELVEKYQVSGIPSLIFLRNLDDESILASDGRSLVMKDPTGSKYPWEKGKVNKSSVGDSKEQEEEEDEKRTMSSADLKLIRFACEQTARSAKKAWSKNMVCLDEISKLKKTIENLLASAHSLPPGPDVVLERSSLLPPIMNIQDSDCQMEVDGFSNAELLSGSGMDSLAGKESQNKVTDIPNTLNLPNSVDSIDQALVALVRYTSVVDQLLVRAGDASTSSRLASRYQIIELIGTLFSKVLPAPDPSSVAIAFEYAKASEEWEEEVDNENEHKQQQTTAPTNTNPSKTNLVATPIKSNSDADANKAKNADAGADAASAAKRQEAALNLMAAYPQYEFDVIVGALEVSGDSVSIAANLIFGKDNAAASKLIASKRAAAATATRQLDSKVSGNLTTSSAAAAAAVAIEEESLYSNYYDTFGPNRDVATQFREDLLFDKMGNNSSPTCIWAYPTTKDAQVRMLRAVHKLLAIYGSMWQAIGHF